VAAELEIILGMINKPKRKQYSIVSPDSRCAFRVALGRVESP
jgi:hypothetical protein